ncbi:MAG: hypothetical protein ACP6IP_03550 [Candidatus Njordarchaeia archaeon]
MAYLNLLIIKIDSSVIPIILIVPPVIAGLVSADWFDGVVAGYVTVTLPIFVVGVIFLLEAIGVFSIVSSTPILQGIVVVIGVIAVLSAVLVIILSFIIGLVGAVFGFIGGFISWKLFSSD